MSEASPTQDELSEVDHLYRRLSALDPGGPGEWVRRKVQAYATQQAAERAVRDARAKESTSAAAPTPQAAPVSRQEEPQEPAKKSWVLPAALSGAAVAVLVGLIIVPHLITPHRASTGAAVSTSRPISDSEPQPTQGTQTPRQPESASSSSGSSSAASEPSEPETSTRAATARSNSSTTAAPVVAHASSQPAATTRPTTSHGQPQINPRVAHQITPPAPVAPPSSNSVAAANNSAAAGSSVPAAPTAPTPSSSPAATPPTTQATATPAAAASSPPDDLFRAAESGDLRLLQSVLAGNVDVNAPDAKGRKALILAIQRDHVDTVKALLAHGANPNTADSHGTTPMTAAYSRGNLEITNALQRSMRH